MTAAAPKPKQNGHGGYRPGAGRKAIADGGKPNQMTKKLKDLARQYTPEMIAELCRIAGVGLVQKIARDGTPVVDTEGKPVMVKPKGSKSDLARMTAINTLLDRGYGKATQKLAGDEDEAPIQVKKVEVEVVEPGSPIFADNDDDAPPVDEEEEQRA